MAAGANKGSFHANGLSVTASNTATGSIAVSVGDLIWVAFGQQTNLTASACSDNLGNTYSAVNAGTDGGTATLRCFYSRVTVAGTLTSVTVSATASSNDFALVVQVIEGPFATTPLDANPANATDNTSPYSCPATGVLANPAEVIMCAIADDDNSVSLSATAPNTKGGEDSTTNIYVVVGYQTVSATTSVTPQFTGSGTPSSSVETTASFTIASGVFTLTADVGTFTLTGVATLQKISMIATVGSYALTGIAALQKLTMNAIAGAYTYTGIDAILSKGYILVAVAGSYILTGMDATLQAIRTMAAVAGSYALTGIATFQQISMNSAVGSFVLSGVATLQKITMNAIAGAYTYTGVAAVLSWGRYLVADAGTYTLTGIAALQKITMNAIAGAYTYTGQTVILQAIRTMAAATGTYVYTGVAASLGAVRTLIAGTGTYVYTGVSAVLAKGVQNLAYRVRRVVDPVLAKVRASAPTLFKRRVEAPKLRKTRVSDPSLFK